MKVRNGFTIVELLVVVVIIAVLAVVVVTGYNGLQARARASVAKQELSNAAKVLKLDYTRDSAYPLTLASSNDGRGLVFSQGAVTSYTTSGSTFCLGLNISGTKYYISDTTSPAEGACGGWNAQYFANTTLSGAAASTAVESVPINYPWGAGGPAGLVDNFSARWQGDVMAPASGVYTFYVTSDDGQRLYVNGSLIIDNWVAQGPTTRTATYTMTAGQTYTITYEYYELAGGAVAQLEWMPPSGIRAFFTP